MKQHDISKENRLHMPHPISLASKSVISRAAAFAVAFDLRSLCFTDKKAGMTHLAVAIFRAGQATPVSEHILPASLLPCAKTVTTSLAKLAEESVDHWKRDRLPRLLCLGGGATTDGVTIKINEKQYFDLTIHFTEIRESARVDKEAEIRMQCKTLLLQEKPEYASGENIRSMLDSALRQKYEVSMAQLTNQFSLVTECAAVMARVALSSVSNRIAPMDANWQGCLSHQLNTAMKSLVGATESNPQLQDIFIDLQHVKTIVRIFKQSASNAKLPTGFHLIQEWKTRFSTTFDVVKRFCKSADYVRDFIAEKNWPVAERPFATLHVERDSEGKVVGFPALEAIIDAFAAVVEAQVRVQASKKPTIHIALPLFHNCLDELSRILDGGSVYRGNERGHVPPSVYSRKACRAMIEWLEAKVVVHDLWLVGCLLHPFLREFQSVRSTDKRRGYIDRASSMARSLMSNFDSDDHSGAVATAGRRLSDGAHVTSSATDISNVGKGVRVREKHSFSLMDFADSHFHSMTATGELSRYLVMDITSLGLDRRAFMEDDFAPVRFWHQHKGSFPMLFKVVCRVYGTPVSSCASERVFSAVNRIITRDRASTSSKTLLDIILVRYLK